MAISAFTMPDPGVHDAPIPAFTMPRSWRSRSPDTRSRTAELALSSAERLRQLAVHLEQSAGGLQPRGWLALKRIYDLAQLLCDNPDDTWEVLRSTAISASHFASSLGDDSETEVRVRKGLFRDAYAAALPLQEIDPACAGSYSLLAQIRYQDPEGDVLDALADAERALEREPEHFWAKWLRAACLRDLERWSDAVDAYGSIDPAEFTRRRAWRYEVLLESRAYCQLRAGNREAAVREFEALLDRFERNPHLAGEAWWHDIIEAARGRLKAELGERTRKLVARHADWLLPELDEECLDDPGFLALVERLVAGAVASERPDYLVVVQIDHWFGQRWRGFVGKVLGIAGARRTSQFVVPPFHPNRVVRQWQLVRGEDGDFFTDSDRGPIHIHQASSENWGRGFTGSARRRCGSGSRASRGSPAEPR
jgi:tetratricopeptide (TPR) repeat protein